MGNYFQPIHLRLLLERLLQLEAWSLSCKFQFEEVYDFLMADNHLRDGLFLADPAISGSSSAEHGSSYVVLHAFENGDAHDGLFAVSFVIDLYCPA